MKKPDLPHFATTDDYARITAFKVAKSITEMLLTRENDTSEIGNFVKFDQQKETIQKIIQPIIFETIAKKTLSWIKIAGQQEVVIHCEILYNHFEDDHLKIKNFFNSAKSSKITADFIELMRKETELSSPISVSLRSDPSKDTTQEFSFSGRVNKNNYLEDSRKFDQIYDFIGHLMHRKKQSIQNAEIYPLILRFLKDQALSDEEKRTLYSRVNTQYLKKDNKTILEYEENLDVAKKNVVFYETMIRKGIEFVEKIIQAAGPLAELNQSGKEEELHRQLNAQDDQERQSALKEVSRVLSVRLKKIGDEHEKKWREALALSTLKEIEPFFEEISMYSLILDEIKSEEVIVTDQAIEPPKKPRLK